MAHARLGFEKALDYDKKKAGYAMEFFQQLYAIERHARDSKLDDQQRHQHRLERHCPIVTNLVERTTSLQDPIELLKVLP